MRWRYLHLYWPRIVQKLSMAREVESARQTVKNSEKTYFEVLPKYQNTRTKVVYVLKASFSC